jgi:glycosyltransferase involved in cell wall biosynthesis
VPFLNSLLALLDFWFALIRLVRKNKVDAVRSGDPLLCGLIGLVVSRLAGVAFVLRIPANNDMIRESTGKPMQSRFTRSITIEKWIERVVISRADVIISPSDNYADFAVSKGADRAKIHIVPYGGMLDPDHRLPPQDRPALQKTQLAKRLLERKWMVHIGRLSEIKHIEDCFDVLETLSAQDMDTGLLLIGDGPLRGALEARAKVAGLGDRVMFLGNLPQDELIALLPYASVVLSPLTGRALAEAAFAARPIVAYELDWQGDLIRNEETGLLVPARDTAAMAAGAQRLLGDPEFAAAMGDAVRERAMALFSPEVAYANELAAYKTLGLPEDFS